MEIAGFDAPYCSPKQARIGQEPGRRKTGSLPQAAEADSRSSGLSPSSTPSPRWCPSAPSASALAPPAHRRCLSEDRVKGVGGGRCPAVFYPFRRAPNCRFFCSLLWRRARSQIGRRPAPSHPPHRGSPRFVAPNQNRRPANPSTSPPTQPGGSHRCGPEIEHRRAVSSGPRQ